MTIKEVNDLYEINSLGIGMFDEPIQKKKEGLTLTEVGALMSYGGLKRG